MLADVEPEMRLARSDGREQLVTVDGGFRREALRQHLLVVWKLAVDQPADQVYALEVEKDLVAARREDDIDRVFCVGQDARELVERSGGNHDARLLDRVQHGQRLDRDAVVVGRSESQLVAFESGQNAGQDRPCLVRSRGEGHLS